MKTTSYSLILAALLFQLSQASAAGAVIVETIKAHVEQHQTRPRQTVQRQVPPAPQTALEQWVRSMLDSLARAK